jgi:hypothetical protein
MYSIDLGRVYFLIEFVCKKSVLFIQLIDYNLVMMIFGRTAAYEKAYPLHFIPANLGFGPFFARRPGLV